MILKAIRFHGAARRELRKAADRYDERLPGLGDEFAAAIEHSVNLIATHPQLGSPYMLSTRRVQIRRFPYSLVYAEREDSLIVIAVAHHRRRPDYWLRRI